MTFAVLFLLIRSRISSFRASLWLDGVIGAVSVTGAGLRDRRRSPSPKAATGSTAAVLTNLAYPIGDTLLFGVVVAIFGLTAWRPGRAWLLLGAGLALMAVSDLLYLVQTAQGTYGEDSLVDAGLPASALLIGLAAWQPAKRGIAPGHRGPARGGGAVHVWARGDRPSGVRPLRHRLNIPALVLTAVTVLLVLTRTGLVFVDYQRMLGRSRHEALTDPLTGLRNRRSLMVDLAKELPAATHAYPRALALFDLNGFKDYNDTYGHLAGDGLLARLGLRLADAAHGHGRAYRLEATSSAC